MPLHYLSPLMSRAYPSCLQSLPVTVLLFLPTLRPMALMCVVSHSGYNSDDSYSSGLRTLSKWCVLHLNLSRAKYLLMFKLEILMRAVCTIGVLELYQHCSHMRVSGSALMSCRRHRGHAVFASRKRSVAKEYFILGWRFDCFSFLESAS